LRLAFLALFLALSLRFAFGVKMGKLTPKKRQNWIIFNEINREFGHFWLTFCPFLGQILRCAAIFRPNFSQSRLKF